MSNVLHDHTNTTLTAGASNYEEVINKLNTLTPKDTVYQYNNLHLSYFPFKIRQDIQKQIDKKINPLVKELVDWKNRRTKAAKDTSEVKFINEQYQRAFSMLESILISEEEPTNDKSSPFDIEFELHKKEMENIEEEENKEYYNEMFLPNGNKNMSKEEISYINSNKIDRDNRFDKSLIWIKKQTSKKTLKKGLQKLNKLYNKSRKECINKNNWVEVRYTKSQYEELILAINNKIKNANRNA